MPQGRYTNADHCPDKAHHTDSGLHESDYLGWHEWADKMSETHQQKCCNTCGFWAIWTPKTTEDMVTCPCGNRYKREYFSTQNISCYCCGEKVYAPE